MTTDTLAALAKDVLQMAYEPNKTSLDAYIYKTGEKHRQEQWEAKQEAYATDLGIRLLLRLKRPNVQGKRL